MTPYRWSRDPTAVARRLNGLNPDAQARLTFAVECVNGLHYLSDLDDHLVPIDDATDVLGHNWQVVDMAHVRWAAGSAITALDSCAAALGRLYCQISDEEWDLSVESARQKHWEALKSAPGQPSQWITAVRGDHRYSELRQLRDALTHKVRPRSYSVRTADVSLTWDHVGELSSQEAALREKAQEEAEARAAADTRTHRTRFVVATTQMSVPTLLRLARDVATEHVETFIALDLNLEPE